jgi:hypothetical protein
VLSGSNGWAKGKSERAGSDSDCIAKRAAVRRNCGQGRIASMADNAIRWSARPVTEDYTAAFDYLCLIFPAPQAKRLVSRMRSSRPIKRAAKDLLRASALPVLPQEDGAVAKDWKKIRKGKALSPILLVQGDASKGAALVVADGYHRICAAYHEDESAEVMCLMASR